MMVKKQHTLREPLSFTGAGLHSGTLTRVTLQPAGEDYGLRFVRKDVPRATPIPALVENVVDTRFATSLGDAGQRVDPVEDTLSATLLGRPGQRIDTVEHLLAALSGCGIDNALVEVEGPEIPILDGSAGPFVEAIQSGGRLEQSRPRRIFRLSRPVEVREGQSVARLLPCEEQIFSATIGFEHPCLRYQHLEVRLEDFAQTVAWARTFGIQEQVEVMRAEGLARGGTLENALVLGHDGWLNPEKLRFEDEPVRHKLLDAIGDTALFGWVLLARYEGIRAGHGVNARLMKEVKKVKCAV